MKLDVVANPIRASYAASLSLAVIIAYAAACWGRFSAMPWLFGAFIMLILLTLMPWLNDGDMPDFSYTSILNLLADTERASIIYRMAGRILLLIVLPVLLGMMAMYRPEELDIWFYGYLAIFAILGALGQSQQEGLLTNVMASFGFLFLASLRGGLPNLILAALAAPLLLHAIASYLLMTNYPDNDNPAAWRIVRLSLARHVLVFGLAGLFGLGGTLMVHNVWERLYTWLGWEDPLPEAVAGPSWLGGSALLRLVVYLMLAILTVFLLVKLIAAVLRQRRSLKAGRLPRILEGITEPGREHLNYAVSGDWEGHRRQVIASYLKTRSALSKLGYGVRISTTPEDYSIYLGRRVRDAYDPMWRLTELFLRARYSHGPLSADDPGEARRLHQVIVRRIKQAD